MKKILIILLLFFCRCVNPNESQLNSQDWLITDKYGCKFIYNSSDKTIKAFGDCKQDGYNKDSLKLDSVLKTHS